MILTFKQSNHTHLIIFFRHQQAVLKKSLLPSSSKSYVNPSQRQSIYPTTPKTHLSGQSNLSSLPMQPERLWHISWTVQSPQAARRASRTLRLIRRLWMGCLRGDFEGRRVCLPDGVEVMMMMMMMMMSFS